MDRSQAIDLVKKTFTERFDEQRFAHFIRNLVNHLDEAKKQVWTLKKAAFQDYVNHFTRLGTYTDTRGERVDVLVIHLRKETTLARGRVTLRNFVADYLITGHGQGKAAVIAAFVSPTEEDWRFSFVKLDYTIDKTELGFVTERAELTPARRYSYLVGKNENCHTAQKQFLELLQTDISDPTVSALETAFSVEKVTKEFYEHYHDLFNESNKALNAFLQAESTVGKEFEERGITTEDFAKKLLGQIVFLYFLQKKGWFGVDRNKPWGSGRKDFIRYLFKDRTSFASLAAKKSGRATNFFNDILEPLFYDALSRPRLEEDHYYPSFDCRIPFLNGGLFEPLYGYKWVETDILLPDTLFSNDQLSKEGDIGTGILDVFDRYNFTVNEAEPLEKEVAVDPEMLGKVFENLLPENIRHGSGTYYTPRVIVHYMCQQALLHYLTARATDIPREDIAVFLRLAERFADFEATVTKAHADKRLPDAISRNAKQLDDLLASITVCDPAIGSGAFPVGMMHEIVRARMALTYAVEKLGLLSPTSNENPRSAYVLKRHAVHHSLYGVDVDPGAVEIAKLRLWLSMVVDEDEISDIQPLPNLDYKIMQGNSLLEEFDGIRLFDEGLLQEEDDNHQNPRLVEIEKRQREVQEKVRRLEAEGKLTHKKAIDLKMEAGLLTKEAKALMNPSAKKELNHPVLALGSRGSLKRIQQLHAEFFDESSRIKKEKLRAELERLEWDFMRATLREQGREQALVELEKASAKHRKPFFLWQLHFSEVFRQHGGFDVVIMNPPYGAEFSKQEKDILKKKYDHIAERIRNSFLYFMGLGYGLSRTDGVLSYILPNEFLFQIYMTKARRFFINNSQVLYALNTGEDVFDAIVPTCVVAFQKRKVSSYVIPVADLRDSTLEQLESRLDPKTFTSSSSDTVLATPNSIFAFDLKRTSIINNLAASFIPFEEYCDDVANGISTSHDAVYIVTKETAEREKFEEKYLKQCIRGGQFNRYYCPNSTGEYVLYITSEFEVDKGKRIYQYLSKNKSELIRKSVEKKGGTREWHVLFRSRYEGLFKKPKIIIRQTADRIVAAPDVHVGYYCIDSVNVALLKDEFMSQLNYFVAVLNSTVVHFYYREISQEGGRVLAQVKPQRIRSIPIPNADVTQIAIIERLVEYILWFRSEVLTNEVLSGEAGGMLLVGYFEQWINALVYELFFAEQLHRSGLYFFRIAEAAKLRPLSEMKGKELAELRTKFEELYASNHPLRQGLFALDSIEEVRIIEGKA